jgi:hypothetical protein
MNIVGKFVDLAGFAAHVEGLVFTGWTPQFTVVHNTSAPTLANYADWRAHPERHGNWTPEQWLKNLAGYYSGLHWSSGPHAFVCPDGVGLFTPFTQRGTHSPAWNAITWGIETVGEFEIESFADPSRANLIAVLGILHARIGLNPADYKFGVRGIHFHKEDPITTHKSCPGRHMVKPELVAGVVAYMQAAHPGDHVAAPIEAHLGPPTVAAVLGRQSDIVATCFGGAGDHESSTYGGTVDPNKPGVALPFHFPAPRPKVEVFRSGKSVICEIVDVGPHNTADRYWTTSARPMAEGQHARGEKAQNGVVPANPAGIDMTPATFAALGIAPHDPQWGMTTVDWQFAP